MKTFGHCEVTRHHQEGAELKISCELRWITTPRDWKFVNDWVKAAALTGKPDHKDSAEYAEMASERWKQLFHRKECAHSLDDARQRVVAEPKTEFGFCIALLMPDKKTRRVIGFAYLRRLWSGNLCLEFLGKVAPPKTASVGIQLLNGLAYCAQQLKSAEIWGECTESSKPFYRESKTDLLKESLEESRNTGFSVRGWQMPGDIEERFSFGIHEVRLMSSALGLQDAKFDAAAKTV